MGNIWFWKLWVTFAVKKWVKKPCFLEAEEWEEFIWVISRNKYRNNSHFLAYPSKEVVFSQHYFIGGMQSLLKSQLLKNFRDFHQTDSFIRKVGGAAITVV